MKSERQAENSNRKVVQAWVSWKHRKTGRKAGVSHGAYASRDSAWHPEVFKVPSTYHNPGSSCGSLCEGDDRSWLW